MHYTGTIWRPPYEADSLLLEATVGCTHHRCKFCTLYEDLPFKFRMSPMEDIKADLEEAQVFFHEPLKKLEDKLFGCSPKTTCRVFLTGANPFVLQFDRLKQISELIYKYFPQCTSIGCFARVTDVALKTDDELLGLRRLGYDGLTIGVETADDEALRFMNKGYLSADIIDQCKRLDEAGIRYSFFYLVGVSGAGCGEIGAKATAEACNQLHPILVGANMLTIFPSSDLYQEIRKGTWQEESELEKYREIRILIEHINVSTVFAAMGASNAFRFQGFLPQDKEKLLRAMDSIIRNETEEKLKRYRASISHL